MRRISGAVLLGEAQFRRQVFARGRRRSKVTGGRDFHELNGALATVDCPIRQAGEEHVKPAPSAADGAASSFMTLGNENHRNVEAICRGGVVGARDCSDLRSRRNFIRRRVLGAILTKTSLNGIMVTPLFLCWATKVPPGVRKDQEILARASLPGRRVAR